MKEGWIVKKLGDICEIKSGKSISATCIKETKSSSMFECYGGNGIRGYVETYRFDGVFPIIGRVGALCGNVHLACGKFNATEHALVVNIKSKDINPYWLVYNLKSMNLRNIAKGVAQPVISAGEVVKINIFVPDFEEQTQIVEELDQLSNIIEKQRQQLSELDNLAQSIFYDMFGDINNYVPLSEYINGLFAGKSLAGDEECKNKVLKTGAVTYDYFDGKQIKNLPLDYVPVINHKVNKTDLLISRMNTAELVGACAYVWNVDNSVYLPDRLWKADVKENANPIYLWKALIDPKSKEQIRQYASGTSGSMKNISKNSFLKILIPCVSLELQQLFAQKIEAIEQEKEIIKQSIAETEELFNSRMDYYFG